MKDETQLRRLFPFEGLCLTAQDLKDEQDYHRQNLSRYVLYLHGHGIVQGLQVELNQKRKKYSAVIQAGFGITRMGQGVRLADPVVVPLKFPRRMANTSLAVSRRVIDETEMRPISIRVTSTGSNTRELCPECTPSEEDQPDAVALCRINVRLGRMVQVLRSPCGSTGRAAESYLKPASWSLSGQ